MTLAAARLRSGQAGSALVMAIVVMTMMMGIGLATYAYVDTQTNESRQERARESSFNFDESLLDQETYLLSRFWPGSSNNAFPDCTWNGSALTAAPAGSSTSLCVDPTSLGGNFTTQDYTSGGVTWTTQIRDNGGSRLCDGSTTTNCEYYYDEATSSTQPRYDANKDSAVWVRAESTVAGKRRIVVSLIRIESDPVVFPRSVLSAGWFKAQGGPKPYVTQNGSVLGLRCTPITSSSCYSTNKVGQVQGPGRVVAGYQPYAGTSHLLPPSDLGQLRARAQADGTYYATGTCPSGTGWEAVVVFVENADCQIAGNVSLNKPPKAPGAIVFASGTLKVTGSMTYYGVIWMYNGQDNATSAILDLGGASTVYGAIYVDGRGGFEVGANTRITYDANSVGAISTYGRTSMVRSSFRELKP